MHYRVKLNVPQLMHGRMLDTKQEHLVSKEFAEDFEKRGVGTILGTGTPEPVVVEKKAPPPPPLVMAATPVAAAHPPAKK